jgi:hypothetical protein
MIGVSQETNMRERRRVTTPDGTSSRRRRILFHARIACTESAADRRGHRQVMGDRLAAPRYEGRLELTWTNKHLRLLADDDGSYEWVAPSDYRVAEARLLHNSGTTGAVAATSVEQPQAAPAPVNDGGLSAQLAGMMGDARFCDVCVACAPGAGSQ